VNGFIIVFGILLLIGLVLFFGVPFLIYFIFKECKKPRTGKVVGLGVLIFFLLITTYTIFEDQFFFKSSARNELKKMGLVLNDDFEIIKNESGGLKDYYHIFELKISDNDLNRLIGNRKLDSRTVTIVREDIESNVWKEVKLDVTKSILTYEYIIN